MIKIEDSEFIGSFLIKSGRVRVSDPACYKSNFDMTSLDDVKIGNWHGFIKLSDIGNKISELMAFHEDINNTILKKMKWVELNSEISFDSGFCGIFDESFYPNDNKTSKELHKKCSESTKSDFASIINNTSVVASCSDLSNNDYASCYIMENKDGIVAVKIVFLDDIQDQENDYLDYDEDKDERYYDTYDYYSYDD